jgi:hypothetical protein
MKIIYSMLFSAIIASCNNAEKTDVKATADTEAKESTGIQGAYSMISHSINDGKKDTVLTGLKQLKIFTDNYMMYARVNPVDSVSSFGIGLYSNDTGTVKEDVIYNAAFSTVNEDAQTFKLGIEKTPGGYKQVIHITDPKGQQTTHTEMYQSVGTAIKTPLDGSWKLVKSLTVKGKDTVTNKITQYKTYYAGHFIFGHTYRDAAKKSHTGVGFGTYEMSATNKIKETTLASTYSANRGKSFDIDIEMNGDDEYKQIIKEANGDLNIEIYQRLKR